jgi:hypothetical protein
LRANVTVNAQPLHSVARSSSDPMEGVLGNEHLRPKPAQVKPGPRLGGKPPALAKAGEGTSGERGSWSSRGSTVG